MSTRLERRIVNKTADYTIQPSLDRPGTVFENRGATTGITFTLPRAGRGVMGWWYRFKPFVAQNMVIATTPGDLIVLGDTGANSLTVATIGGEIEAFCDGIGWFATGIAVGHTYTIAT